MTVNDVNDVNGDIAQNPIVIEQYIAARITEVNLAQSTQKTVRDTLNRFSKHVKKGFKDLNRDDIISYLNSLRKSETDDPNHKWKGTYNLSLVLISTFIKWFHYPQVEHTERPTPEILLNIKQVKKKEKSAYKPSDMWTQEDDIIFLKYCSSERDRCYHAISRDTSARPHELLKLKIKDVVFKRIEGRQIAEIVPNGKTGSRPMPLFNSIPYVKELLNSHPMNNPDAWLIYNEKWPSRPLSRAALYNIYKRYRIGLFPSLLKNPNIPQEDKAKIQRILNKPWNPYIRRHSALTEKSTLLTEPQLRQHAGWSPTSNMHQRYLHYLDNESSDAILEAYGYTEGRPHEIDKLKPVLCPHCREQNKIGSKFCGKCSMILTFDEYITETEENRHSQSKIENLSNEVQSIKGLLNEQVQTIRRQMDDRESILTAWKDEIEHALMFGKRNRSTDRDRKEEDEIQRELIEIINRRVKNVELERSKYY